MPSPAFDRYYNYQELTDLLRAYADEHPGHAELVSIGRSHEGRDIWLLTLTDKGAGPAKEKPAFWVDGNIHASELSASTASLMVIEKLLDGPHELLKSHTFYVVPRLNP